MIKFDICWIREYICVASMKHISLVHSNKLQSINLKLSKKVYEWNDLIFLTISIVTCFYFYGGHLPKITGIIHPMCRCTVNVNIMARTGLKLCKLCFKKYIYLFRLQLCQWGDLWFMRSSIFTSTRYDSWKLLII